ncbi:MAG: glycogen/starch/alpha-glucan phosphorylase, partial [Sphaerochaeta sp.]
LRLWSAKSADEFDFAEFNEGDYTEAVRSKITAENLSQVLYPNDTLYMGKELRLKQQYFFVSCSLADIISRFKRQGHSDWATFSDYAAIQMNDTHPSLAVPELMRLLVDQEGLSWEEAWAITVSSLGYTNHTLLPEALEKWSVPMLGSILPRHLQIIYEINHRFLQEAVSHFPLQPKILNQISIIEESNPKNVRMANLAIVGSHSTNGVAALHSQLLRDSMFPHFNTIFPERFKNKTNGITQRRWLLASNPELSALITKAIGGGWITDFDQMKKLKKFADDSAFVADFAKIKAKNKERAAKFLQADTSIILNPNTFFDVQVKRIHEYKRQLLNVLNILYIYNDLKAGGEETRLMEPTTFLFGGKAAPGYVNAKLIIKLINNVAQVINSDHEVNERLAVHFLPNYRVTMAEALIPATNLSQQISTAGTEASGTGNMKFMINGALTIGTLDGANIEIAEEAGAENLFIFGNTEEEIEALRPSYDPNFFINSNAKIRNIVNLLQSGYFNVNEPNIFDPLYRSLLDEGDRYFLFADLQMYADAHTKARALYHSDIDQWNQKAILNVASGSKFSSDRTIAEYADDIWKIKSLPVKQNGDDDSVLADARKHS